MFTVRVCLASILFAGSAISAQAPIPASQAKNWDTLMKLYPKRALAAGQQGLVAFKLTLDRDGHPTECQVTHSSGHKLLDDETCELLMMHAEYKPPRDSEGNRLAIFRTEGVINWRIPGRAEKLTNPTKIAKTDPLEKKICKRSIKTGTVAGYERICMTVRDWETQRAESVDGIAEIQGKKGHTSGN